MTADPAVRPYVVPAPAAADLIDWPASFGRRFVVLVDVEEEFDWSAPLDPRRRSTTAMRAFPDAHRRLADAGVALACMIDHPIATNPAAVAILARVVEDGRSEIGAQLHGWVNPPDEAGSIGAQSFQGNLPQTVEAAKIDVLTAAITAAFGVAPRAFRAGRYGLGPATRGLLAARGYRLDASVRPGFSYAHEGGPDFCAIGNAAYCADGFIELPSTTVFTGWAGRPTRLHRWAGRAPRLRGALARIGAVSRVPLTPEGVKAREAMGAIDRALDDGERLLVLSFHSPSLEPGHTPYVRDVGDLAQFWDWWEAVLAHLARRGVANASVGEVLAAAGP